MNGKIKKKKKDKPTDLKLMISKKNKAFLKNLYASTSVEKLQI
jgi:hypothetical protein